jgi:autotransporter-associated beta strand protein
MALPCSLAAAGVAQGQVPQGLDKGHRILLEKGFAIHAMAVDQPEIPNWSVFDAGGWNGVDFQFNYFAPQAYLGAAPGNHVWQASYTDYSHTSFSSAEAPYASNCMRIQLLDEQNLNDATVRASTANWFAAARPNYPDTILSVNQIPFAATDANFRDFMSNSQPDMLMIDSYRWTSDPNQGSWNLLSDWQRHRRFALSGNDGSGAHPIPYGFYAQAIDDYGRVPSESELRFEHFGAWAMGYTMTDDFTYNMNRSYSGVESIYFVNGSQQANPTPSYYQVQEINRQGKNLGPALVRLLSTEVRFINGQHMSGGSPVTNPNPIDIPNWSQGVGDPYLRGYTIANIGTKNDGLNGDALLSWFKVLDESLDGSAYSNETYFAVTNGLTDPNGSAADCRQRITLNFDMGSSAAVTSLQRLRRDTGQVEEIFLPFVAGGGLTRQVTIDLDGGTADLVKFNDGAPFVGAPPIVTAYWDSDGSASGNNVNTGAGLGGGGTWDAAATRWYDGSANAPWATRQNAVFTGASGVVPLAAPQSANSLTFKSDGYRLAGAALTMTGSASITVDPAATANMDCVLAGGFGLVKKGSGTLNLNAANTFTGGTIIDGGTLGIAGESSLGAAPVAPTTNIILNGGATLRFNGGGITLGANRLVYLGTTGGAIDTNGNNAAIAAAISGSSLTKSGAGALVLSGLNSYTGRTTVNGGAIEVSGDQNLGAAPASLAAGNIALNGGALRWGASFDLSNNRGITINAAGGTIDTQGFSNIAGYGPSGGFQGPGDLTKLGSGTFFCTSTTGNNLWMGSLILKAGVWKTASRGGFPINPTSGGLRAAQVQLDGGTLQFDTSFFASEPNRGITVNAGGGAIDTQGYNVTWAGPIAGTAGSAVLIKVGSGTLRLNSSTVASTYAGETHIAVGTLQLAGGTALGDLSAVSLADSSGVTLSLLNSETIGSLAGVGANGGNVSLGGTTLTAGGNDRSTTYGGVISGGGGKLTKTGSGTLTLSGANTYTGATTVNAGALALGTSQTNSLSLTIASGARAELVAGMDKVLKVQSVNITGGGTLDVKDNKAILTAPSGGIGSWNGSVYTGVTALIQSGRNGGGWGGSGIVTSQSRATSGNLTSIGVATAAQTPHAGGNFGGVSVTGTDTLVMYTYGGDANLDGRINILDYVRIDQGLAASLTGWSNGDFNYDGVINILDYANIIDSNIGTQGPPFSTAGNVDGFAVTSVPEPGAALMVFAAAGLTLRRRRLLAARPT